MKEAARQNVLTAVLNSHSRNPSPVALKSSEEGLKVIWRFSDGRPGHDTQSKGLVSALENLYPCASHNIAVPLSGKNYLSALAGIPPVFEGLPAPDLLIGAGHATHFPILMARLCCRGRTVAIMRPSLPTGFFDYCLIPEHDKPAASDKLILTKGPINQVQPSAVKNEDRGLILIGGPSRHFYWDAQSLDAQLRAIVEDKQIQWTLSDSPRTPDDTRRHLRALASDSVRYQAYDETGERGIVDLMENAASIWVSEDSMSMIYEALTSGAGVGILRVPGHSKSKLSNVARTLAENQSLLLFDDWLKQKKLAPPREAIFESERCAKELLRRLNWKTN